MLADLINALRTALLKGDVAGADAIAAQIEMAAQDGMPPDTHALRRSVALLQATLAGLHAAGERIAAIRGGSSVYDAHGRRQVHSTAMVPARRW